MAWFAGIIVVVFVGVNSQSHRDSLVIQWNDHKPKPWEMDWKGADLQKGDVFNPDAYLQSKGMTQSQIDQLPISSSGFFIGVGPR